MVVHDGQAVIRQLSRRNFILPVKEPGASKHLAEQVGTKCSDYGFFGWEMCEPHSTADWNILHSIASRSDYFTGFRYQCCIFRQRCNAQKYVQRVNRSSICYDIFNLESWIKLTCARSGRQCSSSLYAAWELLQLLMPPSSAGCKHIRPACIINTMPMTVHALCSIASCLSCPSLLIVAQETRNDWRYAHSN